MGQWGRFSGLDTPADPRHRLCPPAVPGISWWDGWWLAHLAWPHAHGWRSVGADSWDARFSSLWPLILWRASLDLGQGMVLRFQDQEEINPQHTSSFQVSASCVLISHGQSKSGRKGKDSTYWLEAKNLWPLLPSTIYFPGWENAVGHSWNILARTECLIKHPAVGGVNWEPKMIFLSSYFISWVPLTE